MKFVICKKPSKNDDIFTKEYIKTILTEEVNKDILTVEQNAVMLPDCINTYIAIQEWSIENDMLLREYESTPLLWVGVLVKDDTHKETLDTLSNK